MQVPAKCVDLVKRHEGFRAQPYLCAGGYWTVGYGGVLRNNDGRMLTSNDPQPRGIKVTEPDAEDYLRTIELPRYMADAVRLCAGARPLNENQVSALTSFCYNLGSGNLRASTLRRKVLAGLHAEAASEFHRWTLAGGRRLTGLIRRRREEAALYLTPSTTGVRYA